MALKYLLSGFFVKLITGFDDTMVHIPVVANITKTRKGRIVFSVGILAAIILAITIAFLFGSLIKSIPYYKYISATLIFLLAISVYFEVFLSKPKKEVEKKLKKVKRISTKRILKLFGVGFVTALATVIDDTIAYSSLFLGTISHAPYAILGIFCATALELTAVIYFSKKVMKFKWKKEITTIGLIILGIMILLEVL